MITQSAYTVARPFDDRQSERPTDWRDDAACIEVGPDAFFPGKGESPADALRMCAGCDVREQCLAFAVADPTIDGIWGGTTPKQRQAIRAARGAKPGKRVAS